MDQEAYRLASTTHFRYVGWYEEPDRNDGFYHLQHSPIFDFNDRLVAREIGVMQLYLQIHEPHRPANLQLTMEYYGLDGVEYSTRPRVLQVVPLEEDAQRVTHA
ncbi:hypothetical protein CERZMDRAFT_100399 [Cercospora zeae-maydis SCOH1-5]|uniref:Uncharacterized protein n=1 Tax=Cercospora zeae-maydis SCOH1-5 TaxID=717836 RepID=A0A6A6F8Q2_9PEZI|nr:hypothetical protein CERZMDRAFT_100399 [Cercospora zeae-maydis SCOH1-5]